MVLSAYCLGCFATGYYLVRWRTGQDLRELGSGNVGARNAGRVLGWRGFVLTLAGDFAKGALAVWGAAQLSPEEPVVTLALLAVVAGHIWPAQLRFRGGKGLATSLGGLVAYDFRLALTFGLLFAGGWALLRRTVLPGLLAVACLPLASTFLASDAPFATQCFRVLALAVLAGLVLTAHRHNLLAEFVHLLERRHAHSKPERDES